MAINLVPFVAVGLVKLVGSRAVNEAIDEVTRAFTQKAHNFYPNKYTRKILDVLDHDDTKHTGFVLKEGVTFEDIKSKIENLGDMTIACEEGQTATIVTTKDRTQEKVDFAVVAREDVKDKITNALIGDCVKIVNYTPTQPVTALGQFARYASGKLPESVQLKLPNFLKRSGSQ